MSREKSGGLSVTTLLVASGSAAAAAIVVPLIWEGGGVVAAAITPIVVALTSEALRRPVEKVSTVGVWRRTPQGTVVREPAGTPRTPARRGEERFEVEPPAPPDDPFGLREPERRVLTRRRVMVALVTAALAFAIAAVVVTASELAIFGDSVSRPSRTTFFGGESRKQKADPTPTPGPEAPTATPAPEQTPPPETEATPEPAPPAEERSTPEPTPEAPGPAATPPSAG